MPLLAFLQYVITVILDFAVIFYLLRGPFRRFPLVFFFCLLQVAVTTGSNISFFYLHSSVLFTRWYWTGDFLGHLGITLIIVFLIREGMTGKPFQTITAYALVVFMICLAAVSLVAFREPHANHWLTQVTRNLSFGEELLNFVLWGVLIQRAEIDSRLLMVSAGIGVQVSGEVIGITLRLYASKSTAWVPNLLTISCELLCLSVWIWAFRSSGVPPAQSQTVPISSH